MLKQYKMYKKHFEDVVLIGISSTFSNKPFDNDTIIKLHTHFWID